MRKKLLLIAFTFVAFLFVGIVNVNADTEIGDVTFDGTSIIPVIGGAPQSLTVLADAPYEIAFQGWSDDSGNPITTFENEKAYIYMLALRPKNGYSFTNGDTLTITGVSWSDANSGVIEENGTLYEDCLIIEGVYLMSELTNNSVVLDGTSIIPVIGGAPQSLTVPADAPYEIVYQEWMNDSFSAPATIFENGKTYVYILVLKPKSGHSFTDEDTLTIEGISWSEAQSGVIEENENPYKDCLAIEAAYTVVPTTPDNEETPQNDDTINDTENQQNGDTINDIENPQTGDNIALSIALGLISLVGLTGVTVYTKKRIN